MHFAVRRNALCSGEKWILRRLHYSKEKRNLSNDVCHCDSRFVGRTTQKLQERIKQHVPKAKRQKTTLTHEQGTH